MLIYIAGLLYLTHRYAGSLREDVLTPAWIVFSIGLLPGAFGLADPSHVFNYGIGVLLLLTMEILRHNTLRRRMTAMTVATIAGLTLAVSNGQQYAESFALRIVYVIGGGPAASRTARIVQDISAVVPTGLRTTIQEHFKEHRLSETLNWTGLTTTSGYSAPLGLPKLAFENEAVLRHIPSQVWTAGHFDGMKNVFTPKQLDEKLTDLTASQRIIIPEHLEFCTNAAQERKQIEENMVFPAPRHRLHEGYCEVGQRLLSAIQSRYSAAGNLNDGLWLVRRDHQ